MPLYIRVFFKIASDIANQNQQDRTIKKPVVLQFVCLKNQKCYRSDSNHIRQFQGVFTMFTSVIRNRIAVKRGCDSQSSALVAEHFTPSATAIWLTILLTEGMRGCVTHGNMSIALTRTLHQTHESLGSA